ncbi:MAG: hypothetical protein NXI31_17810 [bacterium]|nr:hypothetical protein [bacterium]
MTRRHPAAATGLRLAVFGCWAITLALSPIEELVDLPVEAWDTGILARAMQVPGIAWLLAGIRWLTVVLCCRAVLRPVHPTLATGTMLGILLIEWIKRDCSYDNHAELAMLYAAGLIFWAESGAPVVESTTTVARRIHRQILFVLCLGYSLIGARRIASGGLSWIWEGGMFEVMATRAAELRGLNLDGGLLLAEWGAGTERGVAAGAVVMTVGELLALLALTGRRLRWAFYGFAITLHAGIAWSMDIYFWENAILILGLAITDRRRPPGEHPDR